MDRAAKSCTMRCLTRPPADVRRRWARSGAAATSREGYETMKADRRHELKENDLLLALGNARNYLDVHGKQIGLIAVAILVVFGAVSFGLRSRAAAMEDIWRRRNQLKFEPVDVGKKSLEALVGITKEVSDKEFVLASLTDQGRQALRLAQQVPFPPDGELNQKAREAFEQLRSRFSDNPLALGVALSGLATVEENEFVLDGNLTHKEEARAHLNAIVGNPKLNALPFQQLALDRLKLLDGTFTKVTVEPPPPLPPPPPTEGPVDEAEVDPVIPIVPVDEP